VIKTLIALLAGVAAVAIAVFVWMRNRRASRSRLQQAMDTTSSWGKTAAEKAAKAVS
jgi:hypothetical protein